MSNLTAGDGAARVCFGKSVCVSGSTAIVGAEGDDDAGAAYCLRVPAAGAILNPFPHHS